MTSMFYRLQEIFDIPHSEDFFSSSTCYVISEERERFDVLSDQLITMGTKHCVRMKISLDDK